MTALTPAQRRALATLRDYAAQHDDRGMTPAEFGSRMYPNTRGDVNSARGLAPGAARAQAAGSVLARLRARGWVQRVDQWDGKYSVHRLTPAGRAALSGDL